MKHKLTAARITFDHQRNLHVVNLGRDTAGPGKRFRSSKSVELTPEQVRAAGGITNAVSDLMEGK